MLSQLQSTFKRGFWLVILAWIFIIYKIKLLIGASYSADSYAIYLLGKNIIENYSYYSPAIRDFYLDPTGPLLSRSYPPLFPLLVGITDFFLQEGMAAGPVINLLIYVFSLYLWFLISKKISPYLFFIPFLLPILFSFLPAEHPLWRDAMAGRTTPITLLLLLAALYLLSKPSLLTDNKISISVGLCLGLLTLARFDATIFCFALPTVIYLLTPISIKKTMLMYAALILVMLPWAIRNYLVFGSFLASDNALTAASSMVGIVQLQFFENGVPMGIDNPKLWIYQRTLYLKSNIGFFYSTLTTFTHPGTVGTLGSLFAKAIVFLYLPGFIFSFIFRKKFFSMWLYFITSFTWCVFNLLCISLTSYGFDARYHAVSWFLFIGGSAFFIVTIIQQLPIFKRVFFNGDEKASVTTIVAELLIFLIVFCITIHTYSKNIYSNQQDNYWSWANDIGSTPVKKGELVAAIQAEKVAYYTGWNTIYLPSNQPGFVASSTYGENPQAWKNYRAWLKHWKPTYLVVRLFEYDNPLTHYPHATASTILDSGLDPVVLLKINLDEAALTEQDKINNDKMRALWRQTIHSKMPEQHIFYTDSPAFKNGIAIEWDGFIVPNTPENQSKFSLQRVVLLPNGEHRVISETWFEGYTRYIRVFGGPISTEFSQLPDSFETIDADPIPAFFITDETWLRGVARKWAGFFVHNNAQNQQQYKVGHTVQLPTGDERTITKVESDANTITVYVTGDPIDGFKVGTPAHFKVRRK